MNDNAQRNRSGHPERPTDRAGAGRSVGRRGAAWWFAWLLAAALYLLLIDTTDLPELIVAAAPPPPRGSPPPPGNRGPVLDRAHPNPQAPPERSAGVARLP
jgi:hypothetical protein